MGKGQLPLGSGTWITSHTYNKIAKHDSNSTACLFAILLDPSGHKERETERSQECVHVQPLPSDTAPMPLNIPEEGSGRVRGQTMARSAVELKGGQKYLES